jgi:hypothetical protein
MLRTRSAACFLRHNRAATHRSQPHTSPGLGSKAETALDRHCVNRLTLPHVAKVYAISLDPNEIAVMKKLIITVAPSGASRSTALEYGFLLNEGASLSDYLEGLRRALFLTGSALQSAKVINSDCATEWFAPPDLVRRLNRVQFER